MAGKEDDRRVLFLAVIRNEGISPKAQIAVDADFQRLLPIAVHLVGPQDLGIERRAVVAEGEMGRQNLPDVPGPVSYTHLDLLTPTGTMQAFGASIAWMRENLCQEEVALAKETGISKYDYINANAAKSPVGANGLLFLPYLHGERSPHWNAEAKGVFVGLTMKHTVNDMKRAVMEGCVFNMGLIHNICLLYTSGTSGDKAALFREDGTLIKSIIREYPTYYSAHGCVEQNPEEWWQAVCESTREILEMCIRDRGPADQRGISGHGEQLYSHHA